MADFAQPLISSPTVGAITTAGQASMTFDATVTTGAQYSSTTTVWSTANQAVYQAVLVNDFVTVTHMGILTQTAAGNVDVGIYTEGGTRLVSSGSTALAGTNAFQSFDVTDTSLSPGVYWLACVCSDASTAILRSSSTQVASTNSPTARARGIMVQASALPLPATATFAAIAASTAVAIPHVSALLRAS